MVKLEQNFTLNTPIIFACFGGLIILKKKSKSKND